VFNPDAYAGFVPGVIVSLFVSLALARRGGRAFDVGPILGFGLVMSLGVVLSATVTPSPEALAVDVLGTGICDLTRDGLPSRNQLAWPGEILLNILLFLPLGIVIGLCPPSRAKLAFVALAFVLPFAVEVVQLIAIPLGRVCQSGDVIDNLTGLTLGVVLASAARWIDAARSETIAAGIRLRSGIAGVAALGGVALAAGLLLMPPSTATPAPTLAPTVPPGPTAAPAPGSSVQVTSVPALLDALADNAVSEIVVTTGTYQVSAAADKAANSLWIGARYAGRTKPVTVRAETTGEVTFDGGGTTAFGGITFVEGAHHQTWQGFVFDNGTATDTGVIVFGGYAGLVAPHHITLRDVTVGPSINPDGPSGSAVSFSWAVGGPHDLLLESLTVDNPTHSIEAALNFYHSDASNRNAWNVTVRRLQVNGTQQAITLWDPTLRNITVDTATITNALRVAVRYESAGASGITFANITSTGSGSGTGFRSSEGPSPPGVTLINNSFR
jgi:hypothetical protein